MKPKTKLVLFLSLTALILAAIVNGPHNTQAQLRRDATGPATLGLDQGFTELDAGDLKLKLVKVSQTVAELRPHEDSDFDFTPSDWLARRAANRFHHLGDLVLQLRRGDSGPWQKYDTAEARQPVTAITDVSANLAPTLPPDIPVSIVRTWSIEDGHLALSFELTNNTSGPVQIGALGIPVIFNNILTGRSLKEAHEKCSFFDPYIGQDAGYLQVTRLNGVGPTLVVVPEGKTPFEAYQPLTEPVRPTQTFEGAFAWMVHTQALAESEWPNVDPWNPPTSFTLAPGAKRTYGLKFIIADQIRNIEQELIANKRPVAIGIPGYIVPMDLNAKLFLNSPLKIKATTAVPNGSLSIHDDGATTNSWHGFTVRGLEWGRARLQITYTDDTQQSISYYVTKPAAQTVTDFGNFLFTKQWFTDPNDPFRRSPSVMSYDREVNRIVTQDNRVWIAGLGDEGGSGSWLAAGLKEFGQPREEEVEKYEQFIDKVLWGRLQYSDGPNKYGVRKSLFFYSPVDVPDYKYDPALNWTTWSSWKKSDAESIGRGYNYPHVVTAYWCMYRLARTHVNLVKGHPWDWYLEQAYQTVHFMFGRNADGKRRVGYVELGLMEGDIVLAVLNDLKREGWTEKAADIERLMKERADRWSQEAFPFGSEMAWDSTGQEEVYAWCKYFGFEDKASVSLKSILGYMPTVPHWGYNGNARRYWDFLYGGKLRRIERQLHHYGSGLNAIPVLSAYREHPDDFYLLRIGYGGMMGALSNIDQEGFASVAFHSFPSTLKWDAYSGDYGPNFFGHAFNSATYLVKHSEFGWQAFGGNVSQEGNWIKLDPLDTFRQRVYIAPLGLWLTLDSGQFSKVWLNPRTNEVRIGLTPRNEFTDRALLRIEQPAKVSSGRMFHPKEKLVIDRQAFVVPLQNQIKWVELTTGF